MPIQIPYKHSTKTIPPLTRPPIPWIPWTLMEFMQSMSFQEFIQSMESTQPMKWIQINIINRIHGIHMSICYWYDGWGPHENRRDAWCEAIRPIQASFVTEPLIGGGKHKNHKRESPFCLTLFPFCLSSVSLCLPLSPFCFPLSPFCQKQEET